MKLEKNIFFELLEYFFNGVISLILNYLKLFKEVTSIISNFKKNIWYQVF